MTPEERFLCASACYNAGLERVRTTPPPVLQRFKPGTVVLVEEQGTLHHLAANVQYTYAHAYGGNDHKSYSLRFMDGRGVSWFNEEQLTAL